VRLACGNATAGQPQSAGTPARSGKTARGTDGGVPGGRVPVGMALARGTSQGLSQVRPVKRN
jgi:hypothetical protein